MGLTRFGMLAMVFFPFHTMIARHVEDSTQLVLETICVHNSFPICLKGATDLVKNINEEQNAPWQTVLGSINPVYCLFCSLVLWVVLN